MAKKIRHKVGSGTATEASNVQYDSTDVNRVTLDGAIVWSRPFTITFTGPNYGSWESATKTGYWGDTILKSGTTVTCYEENTNTVRWTNTVTETTDDNEWDYHTPTIAAITTPITGAMTITASNDRERKGYKLRATLTNGSVKWYSNSTLTNEIAASTLVNLNTTVYYKITPTEGYEYSGTSGSLVLNDTNFTISGDTATHDFGAATRIKWSLAVTQNNYIASWTYKINSNSAVSKTSSFTITNLDYSDSVVIAATAQSETPYNYGTPSGTGTFTYNGTKNRSTTLACTRTVKSYTLSLTVSGPAYASAFSISRSEANQYDSSKAAGTLISKENDTKTSYSATIYYGDKLMASSTAAGDSYGSWTVNSVTAPTKTASTGDATSGNFTLKNNDANAAVLSYSSSENGTYTNLNNGTAIASNGTFYKDGVSFNTTYYAKATVSRSRPKYTHSASSSNYSGTGTGSVTGAVNATFTFSQSSSTVNGTIDSSKISFTTAAQNKYAATISAGTGVKKVYLGTTTTTAENSGATSGTTYAYGTTVYAFAKLAAGYNAPSSWNSIPLSGTANTEDAIYYINVSKTVTNVANSGAFGTISATPKKITVNISAGTGISEVYTSTNASATGTSTSGGGHATGYQYNYGDTVYAFATLQDHYNAQSTWGQPVNGTANTAGADYRVASIVLNTTNVSNILTSLSYTFTTPNASAKTYNLASEYSNGQVIYYSGTFVPAWTTNVPSDVSETYKVHENPEHPDDYTGPNYLEVRELTTDYNPILGLDVPAFYGEDNPYPEYEDDDFTPDYNRCCIWHGTETLDGIEYDRWIIKENDDYILNGVYVLTNKVVSYSNISQLAYTNTVNYICIGKPFAYLRSQGSGTLTLNDTNFTFNGSTATHNFGDASRVSGTYKHYYGTKPNWLDSITCYRRPWNSNTFSTCADNSTVYYGDAFYFTVITTEAYSSVNYNGAYGRTASNPAYLYNDSFYRQDECRNYFGQGTIFYCINTTDWERPLITNANRKSFTISFTNPTNGTWKPNKNSQTAYYGDTLVWNDNSKYLYCYAWDNSDSVRWYKNIQPASATTQYTYTVDTLTVTSPIYANKTYTGSVTANTRSYTVSGTASVSTSITGYNNVTASALKWGTSASNASSGNTSKSYAYGANTFYSYTVTANNGYYFKYNGNEVVSATFGNSVGEALVTGSIFTFNTSNNTATAAVTCSSISDIAAQANTTVKITAGNGIKSVFSSTSSSATSNSTTSSTSTSSYSYSPAQTVYVYVVLKAGYNKGNSNWIKTSSGDDNIENAVYQVGSYTTKYSGGTKDFGTINADPKSYTLTVNVANPSYGSWSVSRTSSNKSGAATGTILQSDTSSTQKTVTIYYDDVLSYSSSAGADSLGSAYPTTVAAPSVSSTGAAYTANLTITNNDTYDANLYYNTTGSTASGELAASNVAGSSWTYVEELSWNTTYYCYAAVQQRKNRTTYNNTTSPASSTNIGITGNKQIDISFSANTAVPELVNSWAKSSTANCNTGSQSTYQVTATAGTGIDNVKLSIYSNTGSPADSSGTYYAYGTTVYLYVYLNVAYYLDGYTNVSSNIYVVDSCTITDTYDFGEWEADGRRAFTISFTGGGTGKKYYGSWDATSQTAYYGDLVTVSGDTVYCKKYNATSTNRWTNTAVPKTDTTTYDYYLDSIDSSTIVSPVTSAFSIKATFGRRTKRTITLNSIDYASLFYVKGNTTNPSGYTHYYSGSTVVDGTTISIFATLNQNVSTIPSGWKWKSGIPYVQDATYFIETVTVNGSNVSKSYSSPTRSNTIRFLLYKNGFSVSSDGYQTIDDPNWPFDGTNSGNANKSDYNGMIYYASSSYSSFISTTGTTWEDTDYGQWEHMFVLRNLKTYSNLSSVYSRSYSFWYSAVTYHEIPFTRTIYGTGLSWSTSTSNFSGNGPWIVVYSLGAGDETTS